MYAEVSSAAFEMGKYLVSGNNVCYGNTSVSLDDADGLCKLQYGLGHRSLVLGNDEYKRAQLYF